MSKIPMFPNKFAILASILGVLVGSSIELSPTESIEVQCEGLVAINYDGGSSVEIYAVSYWSCTLIGYAGNDYTGARTVVPSGIGSGYITITNTKQSDALQVSYRIFKIAF